MDLPPLLAPGLVYKYPGIPPGVTGNCDEKKYALTGCLLATV